MEEIKVGEYVRTKIGFVGKIVNENNDAFLLDKRIRLYESTIRDFCIFKDNIGFYEITKHSPNIIDLLEIYDYANGNPIITINYMEQYITTLDLKKHGNVGIKVLLDRDIKSIVTKEKFKSMEYRLED